MYQTDQTIVTQFSPDELDSLESLRSRYQEDADCFTAAERAQLRFMRWLILSGHLDAANPSSHRRSKPRARRAQRSRPVREENAGDAT